MHRVKKQHGDLKVLEIDPTNYTGSQQNKVMRRALRQCNGLKVIKANEVYKFTQVDRVSYFNNNQKAFRFTHDLIKIYRPDGVRVYYDVVQRCFDAPLGLYRYVKLGRYDVESNTFTKSKAASMVIRFLDDVELNKLTMKQQQILTQAFIKHRQDTGRSSYREGEHRIELINDQGFMIAVSFNLKTKLILRDSASKQSQIRIEEVGEELGKGGFANVYKTKHTYAILEDGTLQVVKNASRKIKFHRGEGLMLQQRIRHEYAIASRVNYLHPKPPIEVVTETEEMSTVSRLIKGDELNSLIKLDRAAESNNGLVWTMWQRLLLTRELIYALKELNQVSGIVHRDFKPHNVIVGPDRDNPEVRIIDFGLSALASDKREPGEAFGTPIYMAPEAWRGGMVTEQSDIYSLGITLRKLFHGAEEDELHFTDSRMRRLMYPHRFIAYDHEESAERIFAGDYLKLPGIEAVEESLDGLIRKMCAYVPSDRGTHDDLIQLIEQLMIDYRLIAAKEQDRLAINGAHLMATCLRDDMSAMLSIEEKWQKIESVLISDAVQDTKAAIEQFILQLRVKALHGLDSKKAISAKLKSMINNHRVAHANLAALRNEMDILLAKSNINTFNKVGYKYAAFCRTLQDNADKVLETKVSGFDDMLVHTDKLIRKARKLRAEVSRLKDVLIGRDSFNAIPFALVLPDIRPIDPLFSLPDAPGHENTTCHQFFW